MAARTEYFNSNLGQGELTGIRSDDRALDSAELQRLDTEAMHRVNNLILALSGPVTGGEMVLSFSDDTNPIDPIFVIIAEKIAAAEAWHRWEQFNLGVVARDDYRERSDAQRLREEVKAIVEQLKAAKTTMKADGTTRPLQDSQRASGPVVGGPMKNGSLFDSTGYTDEFGIPRTPLHTDPYWEAR